jgi:hypothetical protein
MVLVFGKEPFEPLLGLRHVDCRTPDVVLRGLVILIVVLLLFLQQPRRS